MAWKLVNLCRDTTDSTGTFGSGNQIALNNAAVDQRLNFSSQMADGDSTLVAIIQAGAGPLWEIVYATYHSSTNKLEPTSTSISSSGAGVPVNWPAGTKDVLGVIHGQPLETLIDPSLTSGLVVRSALETFITRSLASADSNLTITDGDGVSGNPTIDASKLLRKDAAASAAQRTMLETLLSSVDEFLELDTFPAHLIGSGGTGDNVLIITRSGSSDYLIGQYIDGTAQRMLTKVDLPYGFLNARFEYVSASTARLAPLFGTTFSIEIANLIYQNTGNLTFDHSTDFEGTETSSSAIYYYVSISAGSMVPHASHTAPDLVGDTKPGYHPTQTNWRCVGALWNNGSSNLVPCIVQGQTARFLGAVSTDHIYTANDSSPGPLDLPASTTGASWRTLDLNVPVGSTSAKLHFVFQGEELTMFIAASDATTSPPGSTTDPASGFTWNWNDDSEMAETLYTIGMRDQGSTSVAMMLHADIPIADPSNPQFRVAMARNNASGQVLNDNEARLLAYTFPYFPPG